MPEDVSAKLAESGREQNRPVAWPETWPESWQEAWKETWRALYGFGQMGPPGWGQSPEALHQLAATVSMWNRELVEFGVRRAYEFTRLPERLVECRSAPDILRLEMDYLETLRQHYDEELPRLFKLGDEMVRHSVGPWKAGGLLAEQSAGGKARLLGSANEGEERGEPHGRDGGQTPVFASAE